MDYKETHYKGKSNPAYEYYTIKNRISLSFNSFICYICRLMPITIKNSLYRMIGVKIGKNVVIWGLGAYWRGGAETAVSLAEEGYNVKALAGTSTIVASEMLMATGRREEAR